MNPNPAKGLIQSSTIPGFVGSDDAPAQTMEEALKKKREKLAQDKLGIAPEQDTSV